MKHLSLSPKKIHYLLAVGIFIAAVWKMILIQLDLFPLNADEAIVALMARHILRGEVPIFFYGQAYMGSLDAILVAGVFRILGELVVGIRIVQVILYSLVLLTTFWLVILIFHSRVSALLATSLLVIPTVNMTLYTTVSLGGYGEALLLGNLVLCLGLISSRMLTKTPRPGRLPWLILLWGLTAGLGLWANGLTLIYSLPMGVYMLVRLFQTKTTKTIIGYLAILLAGLLCGAAPWIAYAIQESPARLLQELLGSAVAVEQDAWLKQVFNHFINFILLGIPVTLGFRPPWEVRWLVLPLIPFVGFFWFLVVRDAWRRIARSMGQEKWEVLLPAMVAIFLICLFLFTHFGVDPSGRYFLPLSIILAVFGGVFLEKGVNRVQWSMAGLILVLVFQLVGTWQSVTQSPGGLTTQFDTTTLVDHAYDEDLINFLRQNGETRGFTNYWVAYPLAFLSREELIFTPRLPYHTDLRYTPRDDRYAAYDDQVANSDKAALITARNPRLDFYLRKLMERKNITWEEKQIGDYLVFYRLSGRIDAADLDFTDQP